MLNIDPTTDQGPPIDDGQNLPGERMPGESNRAFLAYTTYRDLGPGRSIEAAARKLGKSKQILTKYSTTFGWVVRTRAYDDLVDAARIRSRIREAAFAGARSASIWEERKQATLEEFYEASIALKRVGDLMLKCPVAAEVKAEDGTVSLEPSGRWAFRDASTLLKTAIEIRSACFDAATRSLESLDEIELRVLAGLDGLPAQDPAGSTDETAKSSTPDPTN